MRRFDAFFSNLDDNGGPVMASNTNYAVYWDPAGGPVYPPDYRSGLDQYFTDLAADSGGTANVDSVAGQYNDSSGHFANYDSHFGGDMLDTDPYPVSGCAGATTCLTDAQIQTELDHFITAHGLPRGRTHDYFLLTPPGVESCFDPTGSQGCSAGSTINPQYCAYHGNSPPGPGEFIYANDPYVTANGRCDDGNHPNGSTSDGALQGGLSHEHNESITDPEPNSAWADLGSGSGEENGDKCSASTGSPQGTVPSGPGARASYNQVINGHFYWYQQEWSNQGNGCLQRLSFAGLRPTAQLTSTPGRGLSVSFDGAGSTAPGGVSRYNWQFNDGSNPDETTGATDSHTFSSAGQYTVALTVFGSDGTSIGTSALVTVGESAPSASFTPPTGGTAGAPVSFSGSGTPASGSGSIVGYTWDFGDGGPLIDGQSPTHTFALAGTYAVKLTVTDSNGLMAIATHAVVIGGPGSGGGPGTSGPTAPTPGATPGVAGGATGGSTGGSTAGGGHAVNPVHRTARPLSASARCRVRYRGRRNRGKLARCLRVARRHYAKPHRAHRP